MAQAHQFRLRREPAARPYGVLRNEIVKGRKAAGLTQAEVAERIGQPQSFIAKVEGGERSLDVVEFVAVAKVIGLDVTKVLAAVATELDASRD